MSILRAKAPKNREKRLDAISAYHGDIASLLKEYADGIVPQRIRTFAQGSPDDLILALRLLAGIRNAVTIVHGPRGCAAAQLDLEQVGGNRHWASTALDERDTIMGADGKLRATVKTLNRRYRPEVIFIVATPAVAINNDDIQSVVDELGEELALRIVPVYVSGFASKSAATGYDIALHALVKYLGGAPPAKRSTHVNLLSIAELGADRQEAEALLGELGLTVNTLPDGADAAAFERMTSAALSIPLNPDDSHYLGELLESQYRIPHLQSVRPLGVAATGAWLAAIGEEAGREGEAAQLQVRRSAALAELLEEAPLRGVRVHLSLPAATAFGVAALVRELGGELSGISIESLDRRHLAALRDLQRHSPAVQLHVAAAQPFEEVNLLRRSKPQLYVGSASHLAQAAQLGIPVLSLARIPLLGYQGVANFARAASRALRNRAFVAALGANPLPYHEQWYRRSTNWHIKQEVK